MLATRARSTRALDGCDAVISALGTGMGFRKVDLLAVATRALVTAMTRNGVAVWCASPPWGSGTAVATAASCSTGRGSGPGRPGGLLPQGSHGSVRALLGIRLFTP